MKGLIKMKAKEWIKEHKTGLIITGVVIIGGLLGYACYKKVSGSKNSGNTELTIPEYSSKMIKSSNRPEFSSGHLDDLWKEKYGTMGVVSGIPIDNLGMMSSDLKKINPDFESVDIVFTVA